MIAPQKFGDVEGALRAIAKASSSSIAVLFSDGLEYPPVQLTNDDGDVIGEGSSLVEAIQAAAGALRAKYARQGEELYKKLELSQAIAAELHLVTTGQTLPETP